MLISGLAVAVMVVGLSLLFASPDPPPVTFRRWCQLIESVSDLASARRGGRGDRGDHPLVRH